MDIVWQMLWDNLLFLSIGYFDVKEFGNLETMILSPWINADICVRKSFRWLNKLKIEFYQMDCH